MVDSPLRILVDMDGTIAEWDAHYAKLLKAHYPQHSFPTGAELEHWDLTHGLDEERIAAVRHVMNLPGFYAELEPIPGAVEALHQMVADGHHVTICTSPWITNPTCLQDKVEWMEKHVGPGWGDRVVFTKDKTIVCGDILIDDKPDIHGIEEIPTWEHVVFDQPYNKKAVGKRLYDWSQWRSVLHSEPKVLGLGGLLRSGKDTVADYLVDRYGWVKLNMSEPLHEAVLALNPVVDPSTGQRYAELVDEVGYVEAKKNLEVRRLLQVMGTEVGRNMIDENVWVDVARKKIQDLVAEGRSVVITGMRFPNELEMIAETLGGTTVWVERGEESLSAHSSENSVSAYDFSYTLFNDGTLDDLYRKVDASLNFL